MLGMRIKLDEGAKMPTKAYPTDGGFDIYSREDKVVPARGNAIFDTGVHIDLPMVYINRDVLTQPTTKFLTAGVLASKSGLNVKHNITSEGVIDISYDGSIVVKIYNQGDTDYEVKKGDKISQLLIVPILPVELELVDELVGGERGNNGFGSSGR
jgi:deoxyuridine 5'-triphosphate nucleotidohydrolase